MHLIVKSSIFFIFIWFVAPHLFWCSTFVSSGFDMVRDGFRYL